MVPAGPARLPSKILSNASGSSSAWLVGAAAAAVAGVALLSFSRRPETATSVPV